MTTGLVALYFDPMWRGVDDVDDPMVVSFRDMQERKSSQITARVLVVEDEAILAELTRRLLVAWGHEVVGVLSRAEEAVQQAVSLAPDLIVMDIRLAGAMDGLEAALAIVPQVAVPVLFTTGYSCDIAEATMAELPVPCMVLSKPVPPPRLAEAVAALLNGG